MIESIAKWSFERRRWVVLIWIVALVGFIGFQLAAGGSYSSDFSLPGAESQKALDLLKDRFPGQAGDTADIVFRADSSVSDSQVQSDVQTLLDEISKLHLVVSIDSPYDRGGERLISPDGRIAFATVHFKHLDNEVVPVSVVTRLIDRRRRRNDPD